MLIEFNKKKSFHIHELSHRIEPISQHVASFDSKRFHNPIRYNRTPICRLWLSTLETYHSNRTGTATTIGDYLSYAIQFCRSFAQAQCVNEATTKKAYGNSRLNSKSSGWHPLSTLAHTEHTNERIDGVGTIM